MHRKVFIKSIVKLGDTDPDWKEVLNPLEARRMGRLLKRAVWTSVKALDEAGLEMPGAIITATDYGCLENSLEFLQALCGEDGKPMRPVHFMQSTHNTIGSVIAIRLHCHGYNATYSHRGNSFESALMDAWMQISSGDIDSALVGWHDEAVPAVSGITPHDKALSLILSADPKDAIQEIFPPFNVNEYA